MEKLNISIVCPFFNEAEGASDFCKAVLNQFDSLTKFDWELICVDDGSSDLTLDVLNQVAERDHRVRVLALSRNFGQQIALFAGLESVRANSAAAIMMDSDFQHPPAMIGSLVDKWQCGYEVVSTQRLSQNSSSRMKKLTSNLYYSVLRSLAQVPVTFGAADFCLLDRRALQAVLQFRESSPYLRGIIAWIGFKRAFVPFDAPPRHAGASKYSWAKMLRLASDGIFSFSTSPMRVSLKVGSVVVAMAMVYLIYALAIFATNGAVKGWTSLLAVVVLFGGLNLVSLGLIGEYLGRTFREVKGRPRYVLRQDGKASDRFGSTAHPLTTLDTSLTNDPGKSQSRGKTAA